MDLDMGRMAGDWKAKLAAVDLSQYSLSWDLLLIGVVTLVVGVVGYASWRSRTVNLPPGPRNWPVIGALFEMEPKFHEVLQKFAKSYGDVAFFRVGVQKLVVVSSAEVAEELFKQKDAEFCDRATAMNRSTSKYTGIEGTVFPFANYDAELKLHRKLAVTEFFTMAKIKSYEKLRTQEVMVMVEKIFHAIGQNSNDSNVNGGTQKVKVGIRATGEALVQNIVFALCIGERFDSLPPDDELTEFTDIHKNLAEIFMTMNLVDYFPWLTWFDPQGLLKRMKTFGKRQTKFFEMILERRRQSKKQKRKSGVSEGADEGRNFVDVLLRAQEDGTKITDIGIMGTILTMLSAGIDTVGAQIDWIMLELARHPKMLQRLQYEVDAFVGKQRPLDENDLTYMPYLNAVILETLRLHPSVPYSFPHVNMAPATLGGYNILANTAVIVNFYGIGRDPRSWEDPLQFNPDRFMARGSSLSSDSIKANGNFYNLLPFSSGRRVCPGYNLGMLMLLRTVGTLVHAFDWAPPAGMSPQDLSIEDVGPFILYPRPELYLVPKPRLSPDVYRGSISIT
ncbi:unnamed protein product [Calypogeia fissa]